MSMTATAPEWLTRRGGGLDVNPNGQAAAVILNGTPQYVVRVVPASGKYVGQVKQSNNGRYLPASDKTYPTTAEALQGGLDDLRRALGW